MMPGFRLPIFAALLWMTFQSISFAQTEADNESAERVRPPAARVASRSRPVSTVVESRDAIDAKTLAVEHSGAISEPTELPRTILAGQDSEQDDSLQTEIEPMVDEPLVPASPLGDVLGLGACCDEAPWPGYGVTYMMGNVPNALFNTGAGAVLSRSRQTTSVLPVRTGPSPTTVLLPLPGDGGPLGAVRFTDNNSAIPRDRLFMDYAAFFNVDASRQYDSHRGVFGYERRFHDPIYGIASSAEVRVPFGLTLAPSATFGPNSDSDSSELGNIMLGMKTQLRGTENTGLSLGFAATIPTADDVTIGDAGFAPTAAIVNKSVHITPYVAMTWSPAPHTACHLFYSIDFDTTGSPVFLDTNLDGSFDSTGRLSSTTMHALDLSFVSWLYRNDFAPSGLSGAAWYVEWHYAASLETPDSVTAGAFRVGNSNSTIDISNAAFGGHFKFANDKLLTVGYALPISDDDSVFDGELRIILNKFF